MRCPELDQNEMQCVHSVRHVGYHLFVKPREQWPDERTPDWEWEDKIIDAVHVERETCAKIADAASSDPEIPRVAPCSFVAGRIAERIRGRS